MHSLEYNSLYAKNIVQKTKMNIIKLNMESVRFEPVIPVCEAAMLTTGLARQSQQISNNMLH